MTAAPLGPVFLLLVAFQLKHLLADYFLQTPWMLGKFRERGWVLPLAAHCGVHAGMTWAIAGYWCSHVGGRSPDESFLLAVFLAALDFCAHFLMDRAKASPRLMGRWKALSAREMEELSWHEVRVRETWHVRPDGGLTDDGRLYVRECLRSNRNFWWALGFDQMFHHLTHYLVVWLLLIAYWR
jgi:hypothetical protein